MIAQDVIARLDPLISEKSYQAQIIQLGRMLGYRCYHTFNSQRSEPGYPDLTLLRETDGRLVFLEVKRERGALSTPQKWWLEHLQDGGHEAYCVRPTDFEWLAGILSQ